MALTRKSIELLREDPDDVERYLFVADQLQTRGDVRGELIALDVARERADPDEPRWQVMTRKQMRLEKLHAKELLGALWTASSTSRFTWRYGFIREATLWTTAVALPAARGRRIPKPRANKLLKHVGELLELESAVLLERLTLATPYNSQLFLWDAAERVAQGAPATLHRLDLRDLYEGGPPDWEPMFQREIVWRKRVLTIGADSLALEPVAELFS